MYAKIFQSIYDGSIARDWQLRLVFMDFLVLADRKGVVDMTVDAIARRTGVPLEIVKEGIDKLEAPDPDSRRPDMNGKRIERLDNHRSWGWRIVNYEHYRNLMSIEQKQEIDRQRLKRKREEEKQKKITKSTNVGGCRVSSQPVADVAHAEAEAYTEAKNPPIYISPPLGEFKNVNLTAPELKKLSDQFGATPAQDWIERVSSYFQQIGPKQTAKKYKSHYATILNWSRRDKEKEPQDEYARLQERIEKAGCKV